MTVLKSRVRDIKRAQKESAFFKTISQYFMQIAQDEDQLRDIFITHVELSSDKSVCIVYFYSPRGSEHFDEILQVLKLYKPSMRKALSSELPGRYVPELVFKFDVRFEKQQKLENLFESIKVEEGE